MSKYFALTALVIFSTCAIAGLDGDGIPDADDADRDGDGISNFNELGLGLNPDDATDGALDLDGDGWSNSDEYFFGTILNDHYNNPSRRVHQSQKIIAASGDTGDGFGIAVAIDGNTAIIGSYLDDDADTDAGAAYVYVLNSGIWEYQTKLTAGDADNGDMLGFAVALDGDTAVVGAYGDDHGNGANADIDAGSVYIFTRSGSTWSEAAKLIPGDSDGSDKFGYSVALDAGTVLIGARDDNGAGGSDYGSAYVYTGSGSSWSLQQKILPDDGGSADDSFGNAVALDGDTAAIAAYRDTGPAAESGSVYVFTRSGSAWTQEQRLTASDGASQDYFGFAVDVDGDTLIAGAPNRDGSATNAGAAYVYTRTASVWTEQDILVSTAQYTTNDELGTAVAVDNDRAVVGAQYDGAGTAHVFERSGSAWQLAARLYPADVGTGSGFGFKGMALQGDQLIVGANGTNNTGVASGGAYGFMLDLDYDNDGIYKDFDADRDDDGLPNEYEIWQGTDQFDATDAVTDSDNDGWSILEEFRYGTRDSDATETPLTVPAEHQKVFSSQLSNEDEFGYRAAIDGDTAVISARLDDNSGLDSGAVYVFVREDNIWVEQATLIPDDGAAGDEFGTDVAISGDTVVVGAPESDATNVDSGAAYIFTRTGTTWAQQAKLVGSDTAGFDRFGISVGIDGETAVVGAYLDNIPGAGDVGSVYVFTRSSGVWSEQAKLLASDRVAGDRLGIAVDIDGNTLLAGAYFDDDRGSQSGSAYIFTRSGSNWTQRAKLTDPAGSAGNEFGTRVALDGDMAVVSSWQDDSPYTNAGSVSVFTGSGSAWVHRQKLLKSDAAGEDYFGIGLALDNNQLAIGAYGDDLLGRGNLGSVSLYSRNGNTWSFERLIAPADGSFTSTYQFGHGLGLSNGTFISGANRSGLNEYASGAAYFFDISFDADGDGINNSLDVDRDGDGIPNQIEIDAGLDPDDPNDGATDLDGDSWSNADEFRLGTNIDDNASTPLGQTNPRERVFAPDGAFDDKFGVSTAVDGDTAIIGARRDDDLGSDSGSAWVFVKNGNLWQAQAKITAFDGTSSDYFGYSVALEGDTAVIGAYGADLGIGAAYVFTRSGSVWTHQAKLTAAGSEAGDYFAADVAISGNTVIAGAHRDDDLGSNAGAAYIFTRNGSTWSEQAKLLATDGYGTDYFGEQVDIDGDTVVIGATNQDEAANNGGAAYVFVRSGTTWSQQDKLMASDANNSDALGKDVAIHGDTVVAGAYLADAPGITNTGAAYMFERTGSTWTQTAKLLADDPQNADYFGFNVAINETTVLVGSPQDHGALSDTGSTYLFSRTGGIWNAYGKVTGGIVNQNAFFGWSVALDGDTALAGGYNISEGSGARMGGAFFFDLDLDDDGLFNSIEESLGSDPLDADSDDDGLSDGDEFYVFGTSLFLTDTDGDGVLDNVDPYPLDPNAPGGAGDVDGNGVTDIRDLALLEQALTGAVTLDSGEAQRADTYPTPGDGILEISDLLQLQKILTDN